MDDAPRSEKRLDTSQARLHTVKSIQSIRVFCPTLTLFSGFDYSEYTLVDRLCPKWPTFESQKFFYIIKFIVGKSVYL